MARDVEFDAIAHDKTGPGLSSAERRFKQTSDRIRREQEKAGADMSSGMLRAVAAVSPRLAGQLASTFSGAGASAGPLIAGGIAAAAPLIGASISGAILGGVGAGVAGIGVAIAAQDARVQAAADRMWSKFENRALAAAGSFVDPTIRGIDRIDSALASLDLEGMFRQGAGYVDDFADAIGDAVTDLGNGIEDAMGGSGPAVREITNLIRDLGREVGEGLSLLADNGESAAAALDLLFGLISNGVALTFQLVNVLTELYEIGQAIGADTGLRLFLKLTGQDVKLLGEETTRTGSGVFGLNSVMRAGAADAESYAEYLDRVAKEQRDATTAARDLFGATTSVGEAMARAKESARENGRTLDANTEKGRNNRQALEQLAGALGRQYDATVAVNGVGIKSANVAETNRQRFVAMARQMGLSTTQANRLARQLGLVPTKREIEIRAQTAAAEARLKRARELMAQLQSKTISVNVIVNERRIRKVQNQLERAGRDFAGDGTWGAAAAPGGGRTQPPTEVTAVLENTIYLDGAPVRAYTDRAVAAAGRRNRWRTSVGRR